MHHIRQCQRPVEERTRHQMRTRSAFGKGNIQRLIKISSMIENSSISSMIENSSISSMIEKTSHEHNHFDFGVDEVERHTTPHHTTPHHTTPHHTTPQHTIRCHTTCYITEFFDCTAHNIILKKDITLQHSTTHYTHLCHIIPRNSTPHHTTPHHSPFLITTR